MTLDRGDSPLAGRCPAPLSSVAGLGAMNSMNSMGTVGPGHKSAQVGSSLGSLGQMSTMGSMGSIGNGGGGSSNVVSAGGNPPASTTAPLDSRNTTSFWLELKGVERWFDQLESHERIALMTSLFARTPEQQLHQFSSTIDKALRNQPTTAAPASNLSRFGVRASHSQAGANDIASVYKYRSPLSAGATSGSTVSAASPVPGSSTAGGVASAPVANATTGGAGAPKSSSVTSSASSSSSATTRAGPAGTGHPSVHSSSSDTSGFKSPLSFSSSSSHTSDLYTHAFLPLPRAQGYSPWGTEIRRPNSAAADAWPDAARNSPTLKSASNTGSPNISSLSLETPPPFSAGSVSANATSGSTAQSPIGHPLKPWRTFTPHQNPFSTSGIGQAPDSSSAARSSALPHSSPSSPPSGPIGSTPTPVGSTPAGSTPVGSTPFGSGLGSSSNSGSFHSSALTASPPFYLGQSHSHLGSNSSVNSTGKTGSSSSDEGGSGSGSSSGNGNNSNNIGSPRAGSLTPKDNRLARRSVNVIDVELLSDIGAWLRSLRLHKYTGNLSGMRWQEVIQLSDKDLEERGVNALGARRKLLKMFEEIRIAQEAGQLPESKE